jgi:bifunctional non-homologous end joining protein LigD
VIVLDGEAVLLGVDGRSDFNGLHTRWHDHEVEFYAFDILVSDGEDLRCRCARSGPAAGAPRRRNLPQRFRTGRDWPDLFRHACLMGLEGLVSKHRESPISPRPIAALDQGQEPEASSLQPRAGSVLVGAAERV